MVVYPKLWKKTVDLPLTIHIDILLVLYCHKLKACIFYFKSLKCFILDLTRFSDVNQGWSKLSYGNTYRPTSDHRVRYVIDVILP